MTRGSLVRRTRSVLVWVVIVAFELGAAVFLYVWSVGDCDGTANWWLCDSVLGVEVVDALGYGILAAFFIVPGLAIIVWGVAGENRRRVEARRIEKAEPQDHDEPTTPT